MCQGFFRGNKASGRRSSQGNEEEKELAWQQCWAGLLV
jgi:hypothetical protein